MLCIYGWQIGLEFNYKVNQSNRKLQFVAVSCFFYILKSLFAFLKWLRIISEYVEN